MKGRKPEIKVKAPKFLTDLYRDLRDQRLLPLVIVLLVAIPVVPFVLRSPTPAFVPPPDDGGLAAAVVDDSLVVVSAPAGIRRHGERFAQRKPRDPFVDPNAPDASAEASSDSPVDRSSSGAGAGASLPAVDPDTPVSSGGGSGSAGGSAGGGNPTPPNSGSGSGSSQGKDVAKLFRLKTTARFGRAGSGLLHTFNDLPRMRGLPAEQPIAIFIGASDDAKRAVFSISSDASLVSGQGSCSSGRPKDCQFLTLRPGRAVNIHDARRNVVWRLALVSIDLVETDVDASGKAGEPGSGNSGSAEAFSARLDRATAEAASLSEVIGLYLLK